MKRLLLYIQKKLHVGHVHEIAAHEVARVDADERYRLLRDAETAHLANVDRIMAELAAKMERPVPNGAGH